MRGRPRRRFSGICGGGSGGAGTAASDGGGGGGSRRVRMARTKGEGARRLWKAEGASIARLKRSALAVEDAPATVEGGPRDGDMAAPALPTSSSLSLFIFLFPVDVGIRMVS